MGQRLEGKFALVTGAGQGIGRAIVESYCRDGARVVATDINAVALEELKSNLAVETAVLDVTDPEAIARCAKTFGGINVLVNCSGVVANGTVLDCSEEDWGRSMAVNATAVYHMIAAFLPGMREQSNGCIINIASIVSSLRGAVNRFAYGASKGAVLGITKSIAIDFVEEGIRCNAICPGTIDSPSLQQRLHATGDYEAARKAFVGRQPMGRLGKIEEVAAAANMLASDESAFMTGTEIIIDGGWSL